MTRKYFKCRSQNGELMADRAEAIKLYINDPNMTWTQIVEKYKTQGFSGDDLWNKIIESSTKSRESVNDALGVKPKNNK